MMEKVIIIDDDLNYARVLADMLSCHDLNTKCCLNYEECENQVINAEENEIILMSLILNKVKQLPLIKKLLETKNNLKLIILSDTHDDKDEVACLKAGVSDYISKDVSYSVIFERLKRVSTININNNQFQYTIKTDEGVIEINTTNNLVSFNGVALHLTQLEFDLLLYFLKNKNKILTRDQILEDVWKLEVIDNIDTRTIDVHVKNLRRKLKLKSIYSIRGLGYRWYE